VGKGWDAGAEGRWGRTGGGRRGVRRVEDSRIWEGGWAWDDSRSRVGVGEKAEDSGNEELGLEGKGGVGGV